MKQVKKYPFSKKAMQAMLAATIAFSPVVTTGVISPVQVEAADYSSLDSYLDQMNTNLRSYEKTWLNEQVNGVEYDQAINSIISEKLDLTEQAEIDAATNVFKALFDVYYGNLTGNYGSIQAGLDSKSSLLDSNLGVLNSAFSGLPVDELPDTFFEFLELYHVELNKKLSLSNAIEHGFDSFLNVSQLAQDVLDQISTKPEAEELKKYLNKIGLTVTDLISVKDSYSRYMTEQEYKELRAILTSAVVRSKDINIKLGNVTLNGNTQKFQIVEGQSAQISLDGFSDFFTNTLFTWGTNSNYTISDGSLTANVPTDGTDIELKFNGTVILKEKVVITKKTVIGGGGGGGPITPPTPGPETPPTPEKPEQKPVDLPEGSIETSKEDGVVTTKIPAEKVQAIVDAITKEKSIIPVKLEKAAEGEKVKADVPGALFSEVAKKNENAVVEVSTDEANYKLPASEINVADLAAKLGVAASDVQISISVNVVKAEDVQGNIDQNGLKPVSKVIEFTVEAVSGDKKESISKFSVYVERDIVGENDFNEKSSVAVTLNDDGSFKAVPTLFNGKKATIKSLTNSKYTIVENDKTFPDVNNKVNWAEEYIETLASKYIINGKDNGTYAPLEEMTRAQFTVLLVRALGLPAEGYDNSFPDVKGDEWFNANGELMAAVNYGIIKGKDDGRFAPYDKVTRTQAASMIARAMNLDFLNYDKSQLDTTKKVADFKDASKIGSYAKADIEAVYQAGIIKGKDNGAFDPYGFTKRDQMAKMLAEFLISADLMNDTIN